MQAIAPSSLVRGRRLDPARLDPEAPLVGRYPAASVADEADFVVRTVDELVGGLSHRSLDSGRVDGRAHRSLSFSDIAVLYRTDAQAAPDRGRAGPGRTSRCRSARTTGCATGPAWRRSPASCGTPTAWPARWPPGSRLAGAGARRAVRRAHPGRRRQPVRPEDVRTAVDLLTPLARRCGDDLETFLPQLATGAEVDALDPRAEAVTLLTLHAAKGLEFPVVFLVGCEDGLLPLRWPGRRRPTRTRSPRSAGCSSSA